MKKLLLKIPKIIYPLTIWLGVIIFAIILAVQSPPDIQFPYYQSDLTPNYTQLQSIPAHFDGIHYLRIADYGYKDVGTQAFFPLYPLLIRFLSPIFPSPLATAIFISITSLIIALIGLSRLFLIHKLSAISHLLIFPTSFFFLTVYTESLFLALSIWFFLTLKRKQWLLAAILAGLASSTRLVGSILALSLIIEYFSHHKIKLSLIPLTLISLSGFIAYSLYLGKEFSDPLMFVSVQSMFGAQRTTNTLITLPQVIYRYLRMFLTTSLFSTLSARIYFEFTSFIAVSYLLIKHWHTRQLSLNTYLTLSIILPTLTGTLSSVPRYVLILIPFLLSHKLPARIHNLVLTISLTLLAYFTYQFSRGYFVA